ncbi:hypothetical protein RLO149_c039970 [Roseobacter litoralis Och 149]|uniref:Uncharacterized protein n=1 Tax=Roseobacter litoralis (strain ATCC 49566 / DSM 6996 / JCM 21268 / NBRC 15278 / OCh 149) TaxID=391595 RepID=F7ZEK2_ROSLO|nr:hypothetical protein RLO149_c039970 [Roseobacter litoralis Och 149]
MIDEEGKGGDLTKNTTDIGRKLSEHLNPGMEDALNARYGHLLPGMAEGVVDFAYGRQYARPGLGLRDRYLGTIAALTAFGGSNNASTQGEYRRRAQSRLVARRDCRSNLANGVVWWVPGGDQCVERGAGGFRRRR